MVSSNKGIKEKKKSCLVLLLSERAWTSSWSHGVRKWWFSVVYESKLHFQTDKKAWPIRAAIKIICYYAACVDCGTDEYRLLTWADKISLWKALKEYTSLTIEVTL